MNRLVTTSKMTRLTTHLLLLLTLITSATAHSVERITYYHNDNIGSPVAATDTQGNVIWRENYQPDGTRTQHQGDSQNKLWFTGKQEESTFGVSYFGARWYDPEMGRFLAMDPVARHLRILTASTGMLMPITIHMGLWIRMEEMQL